jgi:PAS domain S-box-containing protein
MKSAIHTKRKIDAVISIKQDNAAKKITITSMNAAAERLVGYSSPEAIGKDFKTILAPRVNEILDGYLEFGSSANDFAGVARRIPNFQILSKKGEIINASLKVFNLVGAGDVQEYELLMRDITLIKKIAELKEIIANNPGTIQDKDERTGLPSINTVVYAIDTSYSFLNQYAAIDVCFALVELGNYNYYKQNYSEYIAAEVTGTLGAIVKKCLRSEDVIGYMSDGILGLVLLDCNMESAKSVFGRMKKKVETAKVTMQNGQAVTISLAIAYTQIRKDRDMSPMITACEDGLNRIAGGGGAGVVQV